MKRFFFLFCLLLCIMTAAKAQSYTQHLQEKHQGKASVTVAQSHEIEELVNGANVSARAQEPVGRPSAQGTQAKNNNTPTKKQNTQETTPAKHAAPQHTGDSARAANREQATRHETNPQATRREQPQQPQREQRRTETADTEAEAPAVDMRKKVMRRSYKVNGYRVQVFAGGNSRADKIKAQNAGNAVKMAFPSQPVYVHFYSPRWICRVGNFRTYEEANAILHQVKKMGYKQACIVSGKINVAY